MLAALVKLSAPTAAAMLLERLKADDPVVRAAAADGARRAEAADGAAALAEAYRFGQRDATYVARAAALAALAKYGADDGDAGARRARSPTRTGRCACARRRC